MAAERPETSVEIATAPDAPAFAPDADAELSADPGSLPASIDATAPETGADAADLAASITLPPAGDIRDVDYARLKAVLYQLRVGLDTTARSLGQLRRAVRKAAPREDRADFDSAFVEVRIREVALRNSIIAASNAPPDKASDAQARVAADYEAYARAVTVAQSMVRGSQGVLANATPGAAVGNVQATE